MADIVLAHGAWSAAWAWKKMRPLLQEAGHQFYAPTYTGLGARAHLATPDVDLSTHIQDIVSEIEFEDLNDVVLLGHSYGGMVATGVADRIGSRLARIVYIDAFAPKDGQSLFDLVGPKAEGNMRKGAEKDGDVSKNDLGRAQDEVQKMTDAEVNAVDEMLARKEAEIMEV